MLCLLWRSTGRNSRRQRGVQQTNWRKTTLIFIGKTTVQQCVVCYGFEYVLCCVDNRHTHVSVVNVLGCLVSTPEFLQSKDASCASTVAGTSDPSALIRLPLRPFSFLPRVHANCVNVRKARGWFGSCVSRPPPPHPPLPPPHLLFHSTCLSCAFPFPFPIACARPFPSHSSRTPKNSCWLPNPACNKPLHPRKTLPSVVHSTHTHHHFHFRWHLPSPKQPCTSTTEKVARAILSQLNVDNTSTRKQGSH